jgi:hypothetical protein
MTGVRFLLGILLLAFQCCFAYERPADVPQEDWETLAPYFLPDDHPIKAKLDKIFGSRSVTKSSKAVYRAGFFQAKPREYTKIIVTTHMSILGYVVKFYLDTAEGVNPVQNFKERVIGSIAVKQCIKQNNLGHLLKCPNKWVYPIPTFSDSGPNPQHFILVAEDMRPLENSKSLDKWQKKVKKSQLDAVYMVLSTVGLPDCVYAFNIPFCTDGKLAFLDTELCGLWPVPYRRMEKFLRGDMLEYWIQLTR